MRFESLTLEHYGRSQEATLTFPASPGLILVFGPNEAGKSSALEAISDFLFGVPDRSARGQIYGADKIRIGATIIRADGARLSLTRRKGRIRTLTDTSGQPVDEAVLGQILGATGRDRFASLFGLGHEALRKGGERLLAAEGDIGRLILDASGGLRPLIETVDGLRTEAALLFDARRGKGRLFYKALDAFEQADHAVKQALVTRERHDKARQQLKAAQDSVADRRRRKRELTEEKSRLDRLARVAPAILDYDRVARDLPSFADVAALRGDFAGDCAKALDTLGRREEALGAADSRWKTQQAKIDALPAPGAVIAAEAAVRDAREKAGHVSKARLDRANREAELLKFAEALRSIRLAIGASSDADLEAAAPPANATKLVQQLAAAGSMRRAKVESLLDQRRREKQTQDAIAARQTARAATGADRPSGIDAADFAALPSLVASVEARKAQLARIAVEIDAAAGAGGYGSIEDAAAWICPDAALIQSEIERRAALEADFARLQEKIAAETEKRDRAGTDIERLTTGRAIPSTDAIMAAREDRDRIWDEIRTRYLDPDGAAVAARPREDRVADAKLKQARTQAADDLADRKSGEAQRVAALDLARLQKSETSSALAAIDERQKNLAAQRAEGISVWLRAWPDAAARFDEPARLKRAAAGREDLLRRRAEWRAQIETLDAQAAEIAPRLEALRQAEAKLNLNPADSLAERKAAASQGVKAHDDAYADYRQDEAALQDVRMKLGRIEDEHRRLAEAEAEWGTLWTPAVRALGLSDQADLERANEIAGFWAAAAGHFEAVRVTRTRLKRMDEDEDELLDLAQALATKVDFPIPHDAVAAAKMLGERLDAALKTIVERETLGAQLIALGAERDEIGRLAGLARAGIEALCAEVACTAGALAGVAARSAAQIAAVAQLKALEAHIVQLGDGLPLETLRAHWGGRDLDEIKAAAEQAAGEAHELDAGIDEAVAAQRDREREFGALLSGDGFNAAVAAQKSATKEMHDALERYVEIALAEELLRKAMDQLRDQQKDPLIRRAGELFAAATAGAFAGVDTDVDDDGLPVVVGRRGGGEQVPVARMSDGTRDQLYLAFRIASIEHHAQAAEPLPFVADDLLVHFDDERSAAALNLLAELGKATQVLLFTHHQSLKAAAAPLAARGLAAIIDLGA